MSIIIDIADAVVAELNSAGSPLEGVATAQRHYRPVFDLQEMQDMHVTVVPRGIEMSGASRSLVQSDVQIDVAVQQKLLYPQENRSQSDGLMELVQQIVDYLRPRKLSGALEATCVRVENTPIFAPEHLDQFRQFTSVLTFTYRVMR